MKNDDLTIMLTLRGRHLHTLRWMWHANRIGLPYHVIIADGDVHPTIDRLLSDPATFPNLSFEYHRHCDLAFSDFYKKCAETIRKVKTRYVMLSDNDDFPIIAGIRRSMEHLDKEPGYVCAGGRIPDFTIAPRPELPGNVIGKLIGTRFGYTQPCRDIAFPSAAARVMDEINQYQVVYYNVYRTEALRLIFEEVVLHDFSNLVVHEFYISLRAVTLGKVRLDPSVIAYFRQTGTSMHHTYARDWVHDLLRSRLPQDYRAMATTIANEVVKIDGSVSGSGSGESSGKSPDEFREGILDAYATHLRHMLAHTMLRYRFPRLFRIKQKLAWLRELRIVPLWYRRRQQQKNFWMRLADGCADPALLTAYRDEFGSMEASLQGDEFLRFVNSNARDLQ